MLMLRTSFSKAYVSKDLVNRSIEVISVLYLFDIIFLIPLEQMSVEKF